MGHFPASGGGSGGTGTVTSVSNSDGTITVTGTPTVAPVVSRPAITGDTQIAGGSNASTTKALNGTTLSGLATGLLKNAAPGR